jgi:hypothetical protein
MSSNPNENLISLNISDADLTEIDAALATLEAKLLPHLVSLTVDQRSSLFKMGMREPMVRDAVTAAAQNTNVVPTNVGTAEAQADLASLDKYRPYFARVSKLAEAADDTEMAIGVDLINFALRVYAVLKITAPDSLKGLLESMSGFFSGGRRAKVAATAAAKTA